MATTNDIILMNGSRVGQDIVDTRRVAALGAAYDPAVGLIKDYLEGKTQTVTGVAITEERVEVARITIAQWSKVRQTDNARAALDWMMLRQSSRQLPEAT